MSAVDDHEFKNLEPGLDIRTDVPSYNIYKRGTLGIMLNAVGGSDYQLLDTAKLVVDIITSDR